MNRYPDYHQRSQSLAEIVNSNDAVKAARDAIFAELTESVRTIKSLRDDCEVESNVRLGAAKHLLKLGGLEVERSEIDHRGLTITSEHAQSIIDAAKAAAGGDA